MIIFIKKIKYVICIFIMEGRYTCFAKGNITKNTKQLMLKINLNRQIHIETKENNVGF